MPEVGGSALVLFCVFLACSVNVLKSNGHNVKSIKEMYNEKLSNRGVVGGLVGLLCSNPVCF